MNVWLICQLAVHTTAVASLLFIFGNSECSPLSRERTAVRQLVL